VSDDTFIKDVVLADINHLSRYVIEAENYKNARIRDKTIIYKFHIR